MLVIVLGIDSAQKLEAIFNVRIDFEQFLSLVGILIMKSTIKNSWMVIMGLYNLCVFSSLNFLLGNKRRKVGGKVVSIFESSINLLMSVLMYHKEKVNKLMEK